MTDEREMQNSPDEVGPAPEGMAEAALPEAVAAEPDAGLVPGDGGTVEGPADESVAGPEVLQRELEALNDRHLRLAAEFDNYRKRIDRERSELRTRSQAELVKALLEALDDLQRVAHYEGEAASAQALLEGVRLVEKKFRHVLESTGLEPIDPQGEFFNPSTMEALMTVAAEHPEEDEVVADVFQKGYRFKEILIRPAKVRVKKYE